MSMSNVEQEIQSISIQKEIKIAAPIEIAFEAMLDQGHRIKMGVFHKIGKSRHSD